MQGTGHGQKLMMTYYIYLNQDSRLKKARKIGSQQKKLQAKNTRVQLHEEESVKIITSRNGDTNIMLPIRVMSRSTARKGEESITHQKMIKIFKGKSHMLQETGSK